MLSSGCDNGKVGNATVAKKRRAALAVRHVRGKWKAA